MKNYSCPYCPGGNEMTWGFSPEGWEWARQKHEDHKVAPVKQKECKHKHIYGTYKGIDCNDCLNMSQPPKSKGRDDTEYAKGIIKGREMQYKLDKLGEPPQTDKTTWNEDYINIKGFQDVALDVYRGKLIKGIGKSKNLLTKNYGYKTDVFILRDEILTLIKEEK